MAGEVQNYLNYIRSMGIKAWIPDSPGYGPKMSVPDQCRSRILCLNYDGSEIYIQCVNNHVATCDEKSLSRSVKNDRFAANCVWLPNNLTRPNPPDLRKLTTHAQRNRFENSADDAGNSTQKAGGGPPEYLANTLRERSERFVVGLRCADTDGLQKTLMKNTSPRRLKREVDKTMETGNPLSLHAPQGSQYRRVVHEKLTKEVRVAKRYVSSLPNVQQCGFDRRTHDETAAVAENVPRTNRGDGQRADKSAAAKVARPVRGFVRRLIERFDSGADCRRRRRSDRPPEEPSSLK